MERGERPDRPDPGPELPVWQSDTPNAKSGRQCMGGPSHGQPAIPIDFSQFIGEEKTKAGGPVALTRRQREVLDYVTAFVAEHGYSPSLEEIGAHFGLSSVATVHKHIEHLVAKGHLRKAWNRSRSVEPVGPRDGGAVDLPLLGAVAAGAPIEAIEVEERISVPAEMVGARERTFVLRVRGDSMIEEHIRDGDYVVVESRAEARNGETVVALVRGAEATLKKFYARGPRVILEPANQALRPLELPARDVQIRGVVRGLLRTY
jgi:repressor LexA